MMLNESKLITVFKDFNESSNTNFIFKLAENNTASTAIEPATFIDKKSGIKINNKIRKSITSIKTTQNHFSFLKTEDRIFNNNLILIDSLLPEILGWLILNSYCSNTTNIEELTKITDKQNPLNYDLTNRHPFYQYKVKKFLLNIAQGMGQSKEWLNNFNLQQKNPIPDILYNTAISEFEDYLFANTRLETASSSKHKYEDICEENGSFYLKLNLQIRFK